MSKISLNVIFAAKSCGIVRRQGKGKVIKKNVRKRQTYTGMCIFFHSSKINYNDLNFLNSAIVHQNRSFRNVLYLFRENTKAKMSVATLVIQRRYVDLGENMN
jgi:hypothetical protein